MKLAVIGSRKYPNDYNWMHKYLDRLLYSHYTKPQEIVTIISGGAKGVDTYAKEYARFFKFEYQEYFPEYDKYEGKHACILRNIEIVKNADRVLAFWDGSSKGTEFVINECKKQNKPCDIVRTPIFVYTDGSATTHQNTGGWAYTVVHNDIDLVQGSGGELNATNNQMELMAAVQGLMWVNTQTWNYDYPIVLVTDSEYVINQGLKNHKTNTNHNLVHALQFGFEHLKVLPVHVYGHTGDKYNELVNKLANEKRLEYDRMKNEK